MKNNKVTRHLFSQQTTKWGIHPCFSNPYLNMLVPVYTDYIGLHHTDRYGLFIRLKGKYLLQKHALQLQTSTLYYLISTNYNLPTLWNSVHGLNFHQFNLRWLCSITWMNVCNSITPGYYDLGKDNPSFDKVSGVVINLCSKILCYPFICMNAVLSSWLNVDLLHYIQFVKQAPWSQRTHVPFQKVLSSFMCSMCNIVNSHFCKFYL